MSHAPAADARALLAVLIAAAAALAPALAYDDLVALEHEAEARLDDPAADDDRHALYVASILVQAVHPDRPDPGA